MPTSFQEVYALFLDNINDLGLISYNDEINEELLESYLQKAIIQFAPYCNKLDHIDLVHKKFNQDLTKQEVNILAEYMVLSWLRPYVNNSENLKSVLSTADYSIYSPANMLKQLSDYYAASLSNVTSLRNEYTLLHDDYNKWKR